jgi:hypothetical protein
MLSDDSTRLEVFLFWSAVLVENAVAVAREDEVVDVVGVGGQGESEGRGKESEGEESFAHHGIPFVWFCGIRMFCGLRMRPSGGGVKVEVWADAACAFFPPTALRCLLVMGKLDDD